MKNLLISTHAPHARRGSDAIFLIAPSENFYSRASCEARLGRMIAWSCSLSISTHAPHARRGRFEARIIMNMKDFYSRASCEARLPRGPLPGGLLSNFYSRASCEARQRITGSAEKIIHFYSRASCEARLCRNRRRQIPAEFLLTRLMRGAAIFSTASSTGWKISTHAPHARRGLRT